MQLISRVTRAPVMASVSRLPVGSSARISRTERKSASGDGDALLTARQFRRLALPADPEADAVSSSSPGAVTERLADAPVARYSRQHDVFQRGKAGSRWWNWKTNPMDRPRAAREAGLIEPSRVGAVEVDTPAGRTIEQADEVQEGAFPEPEGPMRAVNSRRSARKSIPFSTCVTTFSPKSLVTIR